jgi:large subunit ribosomal protein L3
VAIELMCRKLGTTRIYDDEGGSIPVTVLEAGPNSIVQIKTPEKDGYAALQLGFADKRPSRTTRAMIGHFDKAKVAPKYFVGESRVEPAELEGRAPGGEISVELFQKGQKIDVTGTSKGRGTAGVVKRHHIRQRGHAHGAHEYFRHGGAIGTRSYPGKVHKGLRMAGRMGNERVTTRNLVVARIDAGRNLLFVRGSVPGHPGALVRVRPAVAPR